MSKINHKGDVSVTPEQRVSLLNCIILSEIIITALENLRGTHVYRRELKQKGELFKKECEKLVAQFMPIIWGKDDETLYRLMEEMKTLSERLANSRPEAWNMVNEMIDKYNEDPGLFLERNDLSIIEKT